jgi:hypothetical protein
VSRFKWVLFFSISFACRYGLASDCESFLVGLGAKVRHVYGRARIFVDSAGRLQIPISSKAFLAWRQMTPSKEKNIPDTAFAFQYWTPSDVVNEALSIEEQIMRDAEGQHSTKANNEDANRQGSVANARSVPPRFLTTNDLIAMPLGDPTELAKPVRFRGVFFLSKGAMRFLLAKARSNNHRQILEQIVKEDRDAKWAAARQYEISVHVDGQEITKISLNIISTASFLELGTHKYQEPPSDFDGDAVFYNLLMDSAWGHLAPGCVFESTDMKFLQLANSDSRWRRDGRFQIRLVGDQTFLFDSIEAMDFQKDGDFSVEFPYLAVSVGGRRDLIKVPKKEDLSALANEFFEANPKHRLENIGWIRMNWRVKDSKILGFHTSMSSEADGSLLADRPVARDWSEFYFDMVRTKIRAKLSAGGSKIEDCVFNDCPLFRTQGAETRLHQD